MDAREALTMLGGIATGEELLRCTTRRKVRTSLRAGAVVRTG